MRDSVRQVRALLVLLLRHFQRRALKAGANPRQSGVPSFLLLSLVWAAYVGNALWNLFVKAASDRSGPAEAIAWQLLGLTCMLVGFGLAELVPEIGKVKSPLRAALLDELPVTTFARVALAWIRNPFVIGLSILAMLAWAPDGHGGVAVARQVALGLLLFFACTTTGYALATWVRVLFSARGRRAIAVGSFVLAIGGFPLISAATGLRHWRGPGRVLQALAVAIHEARGGWAAAVALAAIWMLASLAIALGELRGYDRLDATTAGPRKATRGRLTLDRAEHVLARREGGLVLAVIEWLLLAALVAGSVYGFLHAPPRDAFKQGAYGYSLAIAYLGALIALNLAGAAARRDAGVRALLAPLPVSPYETLEGKVRVIRRLLLPLFLSAVPVVALTTWNAGALGFGVTAQVLWRSTLTLLAVWLAADASVSVAFLTNGIGLPGTRSMGAPTSFAAQLLLLPLLAVASAPDALVAAASTATVAAVAFEARRAARRCVRWLDDAADDVERETTVWRALLVLAVFFAVQALGAQFLRLGQASSAVTLTVTYGIAAVALVGLTVQGRRQMGPLRIWPQKPLALPIGLVAGALSAAAALGFAWVIHKLGPVAGAELDTTGNGKLWLGLSFVVLAPIAEEIFFRGWLQDAIAADLPAAQRRWAFALAALAFACSHVGTYLVPQLVLGLFAGALYAWSGGLLPGIIAHAVHNGLVLYLSQ